MTATKRFVHRALLTAALRAAAHFTLILKKDPDCSPSLNRDAEHDSGYTAAVKGLSRTQRVGRNSTSDILNDLGVQTIPKKRVHRKKPQVTPGSPDATN